MFDLKKFSKTQIGIGIGLLASILGIIAFFSSGNGENIELNSAIENNGSNNQNIVINKIEEGTEIKIIDEINNFYKDDVNPEYLNPRNKLTEKLNGENLIRGFFEIGNKGKYRDACSLLNSNKCNSKNGSDLKMFSRFWIKLDGGYNILNIYKSKKQPDNGEIVYCINYEYKLKQDMNIHKINELFQYRVKKREDGAFEISSRVCEKISKGTKSLPCLIKTNNLYCG
ncbi:MAG: hypothetical protein Q9M94_07650 [Candidatus Gracilibacteria bacterium]|nr:hypothetical protein [Candidatus Gracilibacteria bacterium]